MVLNGAAEAEWNWTSIEPPRCPTTKAKQSVNLHFLCIPFAHYIGARSEENTTMLLITLKASVLSAAVMMSSCRQFPVRALAFCV